MSRRKREEKGQLEKITRDKQPRRESGEGRSNDNKRNKGLGERSRQA
jgi:hypothetical protein